MEACALFCRGENPGENPCDRPTFFVLKNFRARTALPYPSLVSTPAQLPHEVNFQQSFYGFEISISWRRMLFEPRYHNVFHQSC